LEKLSVSLEDYIEEIYNQVLKNGSAKVTDISNAINVRKSSVTGALNSLAEKKLINYAPYSPITLTKYGEKIAKEILKKHEAISDFFTTVLGLTYEESLDTACKMEHIVSDKMLKHIAILTDFVKNHSMQCTECNECIKFKEKLSKLYNS